MRSAKRDHVTLHFGALSFWVAASVGLLWASEGDVKKPVVTVVDRNAPLRYPQHVMANAGAARPYRNGSSTKAGSLNATFRRCTRLINHF